MSYNPEGLRYWCDLNSCALPWVPLPVFVWFRDCLKGVGGLVSEQCAKLGMLK